MRRSKINIGDKFGTYTIIKEIKEDSWKRKRYVCECICGLERTIRQSRIKDLNKCTVCNHTEILKIGEKRHNLTFLGHTEERRNNHQVIEVKCDCGTIKKIKAYHFGVIKTCGCLKHKIGKENVAFKGYEFINRKYFSNLRSGAEKRNLEFNITIEYINDLLEQQNHKCALSGLGIYMGNNRTVATASLDRIDNNKGYIEGNVQWLHKTVNKMKWQFGQQEFIHICSLIGKQNIC